jgi:hypothetical protein
MAIKWCWGMDNQIESSIWPSDHKRKHKKEVIVAHYDNVTRNYEKIEITKNLQILKLRL